MDKFERNPGMPGAEVVEAEPELALAPPPMYQVMLHNDDYTPMEFVVLVLEKYFNMDHGRASIVMYEVHTHGLAVCGVFTRDIAETKVSQVTEFARENNYPLLCTMEKVE
jgi:ATP-dependent Clp protease adaptor protein ClpS